MQSCAACSASTPSRWRPTACTSRNTSLLGPRGTRCSWVRGGGLDLALLGAALVLVGMSRGDNGLAQGDTPSDREEMETVGKAPLNRKGRGYSCKLAERRKAASQGVCECQEGDPPCLVPIGVEPFKEEAHQHFGGLPRTNLFK